MKFYDVKERKNIEVADKDVTVVTMKNGRKAAKASVTRNGKSVNVFRILSAKQATALK